MFRHYGLSCSSYETGRENHMETPQAFKLTYVKRQNPHEITADYDKAIDTMFLNVDAPEGLRSTCYIADGVHIVYDPETNQVVGFRIEDWRTVFLRRHPDLQRIWRSYTLRAWLSSLLGQPRIAVQEQASIIQVVEQYTPCYSSA